MDSRRDLGEQIALFDLSGDDEHGESAAEVELADAGEDGHPAESVGDMSSAQVDGTDGEQLDSKPDISERSDKPWETLPVGSEADGHALIVTATGTYTPSGQKLGGPVDSIETLSKLILWASLTPCGAPPQIWLVGTDACELLGWTIDPGSEDDVDDLEQLRVRAAEELGQVILSSMPTLTNAGWSLRGDPGHVVRLSRGAGKETRMTDVILEPYVWTYWNKDFGWGNRIGDMGVLGNPARGTYLPDDDLHGARELGRRLSWSVREMGVLPGPTPARTGAAILDKIRRNRLRTGKGVVIDAAGPVPPLDSPPRGDLEPAAGWARIPDSEDLDGVETLVTIDQRAAYLASAGMLEFGYGRPQHTSSAAQAAAEQDKPPFGLWRVTLPAAHQYELPEKLPLPHPAMQPDRPVQTWVTTISLVGLCAPVVDGGMGLAVDDLDVTEAWLYPKRSRALEKWAAVLRQSRAVAVESEDKAMKLFVSGCYKGYVGRMVNPDMWTAPGMQHHHQPVWRAAIMAHCRWRGRQVAMRIARQTGRWPIRTATDSWTYLLGPGEDIADDSAALGKMAVEKRADVDGNLRALFEAARDVHDVRVAISAAFETDDEDEVAQQ